MFLREHYCCRNVANGTLAILIPNSAEPTISYRAFLLLARVLIDDGKFGEARTELQHLLKRWVKDEELAEARFLLGTCYEREGLNNNPKT